MASCKNDFLCTLVNDSMNKIHAPYKFKELRSGISAVKTAQVQRKNSSTTVLQLQNTVHILETQFLTSLEQIINLGKLADLGVNLLFKQTELMVIKCEGQGDGTREVMTSLMLW